MIEVEVEQLVSEEEMRAEMRLRLDAIYSGISKKRDEWVQHRAQSGVEQRWRRAQMMYDGKDPSDTENNLENLLKNGPQSRKRRSKRSRVVINIVRPKVQSAVARMCEILLPVDDRNWGIKPTPSPELMADTRREGDLVDPQTGENHGSLADIAKGLMEDAKKASEAMQREIDDKLTESDYNGAQRRMMEDGGRLGTGIIKGPVPRTQYAYNYAKVPGEDGRLAMQRNVTESIQPGSLRVDPWDVFPDPACGNDHQRGSGLWERRMVTRKELRALKGVPGFDEEIINEILREEPKCITVAEGRISRHKSIDGQYELWEYHGELEPEDMGLISSKLGTEELAEVEAGVLVMVNDRVVGGMPAWYEEGVPYDFYVWREADDSPFGYGIPDEMESQQRVVNASWRQLMDNAGHSSGPQVVIRKGMVDPADGVWELSPYKFWYAKDDLEDASKAFGIFTFPSNLEELLQIAQTAMAMADQETNMPQIMQGDQGSAPDTVGGMTMLMNQANAVMRHRVKLFDDQITRPHIRRYYDWFMANSEKEEIKGDYEVDARGSSALIERDIQNQAMLNVANLAANPVFGPLIQAKAAPALRAILKSFRVDPDEFCPTDDEIEAQEAEAAQQPPPEDPQVARSKAQVQIKEMDVAIAKDQMEHDKDKQDAEMEYKMANLIYNKDREQSEYEIAMTVERNKRDLALLSAARAEQIKIGELEAKTGLEKLKIQSDREMFNAEMAVKVNQGSGI